MFFKSITYTWWQIGIFKLALLAIGIAIGAYWYEFFKSYYIVLILIAVFASVYIVWISLNQLK